MDIKAYIRTTLAKPYQGKYLHKEGASVVFNSKISTKNLGTFFLTPPDPVSLSLNDAKNFIDKAIKIKERLSASKNVTIFPKKYKPTEIEAMGLTRPDDVLKIDPEAEVIRKFDTEKMYSFLQSGTDAMISLITSIESFANIMIPRDHKEKITRKGVENEYDKDKIVLFLSTEAKLEIIARLHDKTDFKGKIFWQSYLEVKRIRNEFIHFKQGDVNINSLWNSIIISLIDSDLEKFYQDTIELIKYFRVEYFD